MSGTFVVLVSVLVLLPTVARAAYPDLHHFSLDLVPSATDNIVQDAANYMDYGPVEKRSIFRWMKPNVGKWRINSRGRKRSINRWFRDSMNNLNRYNTNALNKLN